MQVTAVTKAVLTLNPIEDILARQPLIIACDIISRLSVEEQLGSNVRHVCKGVISHVR